MSDHLHTQTVPRPALWAAAFLIMLTLGLAGASRMMRSQANAEASPPAREVVMVRFEDRPDGSLAVLEAESRRELSALPPGSNGFVRGVLRGMFRSRKLESMSRDASFRLAREADGRLTLDDPESGRRVDLDSFGPTNSAAFEGILVAARVSPPPQKLGLQP